MKRLPHTADGSSQSTAMAESSIQHLAHINRSIRPEIPSSSDTQQLYHFQPTPPPPLQVIPAHSNQSNSLHSQCSSTSPLPLLFSPSSHLQSLLPLFEREKLPSRRSFPSAPVHPLHPSFPTSYPPGLQKAIMPSDSHPPPVPPRTCEYPFVHRRA